MRLESLSSWNGDYSWEDQDLEEVQAYHLDTGPNSDPLDEDQTESDGDATEGCRACYWTITNESEDECCQRCSHDLVCVRVDCCHHDLNDLFHSERGDCRCRCATLSDGVVACASCSHLSECAYGQFHCDEHPVSGNRLIATESLRAKLIELRRLRQERSRLDTEYETLRAELTDQVMTCDIEILDPEVPDLVLAKGTWKTSNALSAVEFKKDNPDLYKHYLREKRGYYISFN